MAQIAPMRIPGKWREGYVLDRHTLSSQYLGDDEFGHAQYDTVRSEMGELLYRLKYKSDRSALGPIVETAAAFVESWGPSINLVVPVPASRQRSWQRVMEIASGLGSKLNLPVRADCVVKVKDTPELKNIFGYHARLELLENAYSILRQTIEGHGILLFDDLFRSGATLNAVTSALYAHNASNVYALALTRTRSIA
jgi:competence protein ComFC